MNRSYSYAAQFTFDLVNRLQSLSTHSGPTLRTLARIANRFAKPVARRLGVRHVVKANLYGQTLVVPAEHPLATILKIYPQCNRPLGLAVEAIAALSANNSAIVVVDVGANIGDTVAIVEQRLPGICSYLCIEADENMAALCRLNNAGNDRVTVKQSFIGEEEGSLVRLEDDGRANPSTKLATMANVESGVPHDRLVRLDTVVLPFARAHGGLSLIKVDTEGYDFSVLRSGPTLLSRYSPALYFEWFPRLLAGLNEEVWSGFEFLEQLGYGHFVFFTSQGDFYCEISDPDRFFLQSLASVTQREGSFEYFDVFASTDEIVSNRIVELSITHASGTY